MLYGKRRPVSLFRNTPLRKKEVLFMKEKIIGTKKNGMLMLLLTLFLYALAIFYCCISIAGIAFGGNVILITVSIIWIALGWILLCGLKVLKPQEALVLTLFGRYVGTLKGEGFYFVNPFCSSVNPAAKTRLGQSAMWTRKITKAVSPSLSTITALPPTWTLAARRFL